MVRAAVVLAAVLITTALPGARQTAGQPRAGAGPPRMPLVPEREWTDRHRTVVTAAVGTRPITNDIRVLLNHPDLVPGVMPFWNYIAAESTLPRRDRRLLILRTALVSRSPYVWARYATAADGTAAAGTTDAAALAALAATVDLSRLDPFDAALLRAADELHATSFVDEATWRVLSGRYCTEQLMDAVFTVAELSMLSMTMNSLRVPLDADFTARLPALPRPAAASRVHPVLDTPRIPPLEPTFWTGELRVLLDPDATGRDVAAIYRTFARHPALYEPRQKLSEYIRLESTVPARARELGILRIGVLCGSDYEWAAHVRAARAARLSAEEVRRVATGEATAWTGSDLMVIRAVNELYRDDDIGDATWQGLTQYFDRRQLLDLLVTIGGYRMVSMALNTFGVPLEANSERIPGR